MKVKYIITEERKIEDGNLFSVFQVDLQLEDITPIEMPSMLLAERMEAIQVGLIQQFLQQNQKYQDALKKWKELAQQGISLHFQTPCSANDTKEIQNRDTP
ncbi:hypothetical protein [Capnocytophaga canis]|uniref:hypothetical protein n=1 Tax=Capnocytophaga canis TaxID=1848903 RepID=UPI0037D2C3FA